MSDLADFFPFSGVSDITDLGVGTATADQYIAINGAGNAVIGKDLSVVGGAGGDTIAGVEYTSSPSDVTLVAGDKASQVVSISTAEKSVNLPDATTMTNKGFEFFIKNSGTFPVTIRDNSGIFLGYLMPSQGVAIVLQDNATAAGVWHLIGDYDHFSKHIKVANPDTSLVQFVSGDALDNTRVLITYLKAVYPGPTYSLKCFVASKSGTTLSMGTAVTVASGFDHDNSKTTACTVTSTDKAIVSWTDDTPAGNSVGKTAVVTVSGTTITAYTPVDFDDGSTRNVWSVSTCLLDTDKVFYAYSYKSGASEYVFGRIGTVSGTTVVMGDFMSYSPFSWTTLSGLTVKQLETDRVIISATLSNGDTYLQANSVTGTSFSSIGAGALVINDNPYDLYSSDVCVLDPNFVVVISCAGTGSGAAWCFMVSAASVYGTYVTDLIDAPPLGIHTFIPGTVTTNPSVNIEAIDSSSFYVVVPHQGHWQHKTPIGVVGTWNGSTFSFTEPELIADDTRFPTADEDESTMTIPFTDPKTFVISYNGATIYSEVSK